MRTLSYAQAIREAHAVLLRRDPRVFLIGQGLWSPWYAGTTLKDLDKEFGKDRIIDSPISEKATTGAAIGAAAAGMRPIVFHPRMDFMLLAIDPIINQAGNWSYIFAGRVAVPVVIRSVINRGGEQGAQHSQALHAMLAHIPGLKVVMPSTAYDAKGLLIAAMEDDNPVVYIDDRWLYETTSEVPEDSYSVPIGKGIVRKEGGDITIAAISYMAEEAMKAAEGLEKQGVDAEVIDLRSAKPLDVEIVINSVKKTGRLVVADVGWKTFGLSAEVAASVASEVFHDLKGPIERVSLPDLPAPSSKVLEAHYYPRAAEIEKAVKRSLGALIAG
ncbi:MAG: alpha-ketoacid dehydrogenase subunit beta [bacterium]